MRVRSSSLESISTAMSVRIGDVKPHPLSQSRSCSVGNLQNGNLTNQETPSESCDVRTCVVDRERYTDSVSSSYSSEGEGDSPKVRGFTQSLPAEIERKISIGSTVTHHGDIKDKDVDCFSDNFITTPQLTQIVSVGAFANVGVLTILSDWFSVKPKLCNTTGHSNPACV